MEVELSENQKSLIEKIAHQNNLSDYEILTSPGSQKGDNFLGILTTVTIKNDDKQLNLILKSAHESEAFRKAAPLREAYIREIFLYQNIFEEFEKFQDQYNISDVFNCYPKIYDASTEEGKECFIMGDLRTEGYTLWNKKLPMNSGHIQAVLKEYAKLHAISVALKNIDPELFEKLTASISQHIFENNDLFTQTEKLNSYISQVCLSGYKAIEDDCDLTNFLKKVENGLADLMLNELKKPEYKQVVIHGDCWCNNLMFKYDNNNNTTQPSSLKILDWQIASVSSPALDFCYFFLAHSPKEILDDYKSYMKLYYDTFSKQLRNFNCDPDEVFPYSRFEEHVRHYMVFGMYMCFLVFKIMLAESEEAPDFADISEENGGDLLKGLDFQVKNFEGFKKRIKDVIIFLKENNFVK